MSSVGPDRERRHPEEGSGWWLPTRRPSHTGETVTRSPEHCSMERNRQSPQNTRLSSPSTENRERRRLGIHRWPLGPPESVVVGRSLDRSETRESPGTLKASSPALDR